MKKVSPQIYFLRRILHYFGIGLLIVLLLFLWSLYRGPIAVPYLKPYIIQALNYDEIIRIFDHMYIYSNETD